MTRRPTREECWAEAAMVIVEAEYELRRDSIATAAARSYGVLSGRMTQAQAELRIAEIRVRDFTGNDLPVPPALAEQLEACRAAAAAETAAKGGDDT